MDVVTLGESMITFVPGRPGRLADAPSFDRTIGGAESNVACVLAAAGHTARWVSRVGADGFGRHLVEVIAGYGVDVTSVTRDPARPTGVYFRTAGERGTGVHEVAYYRTGSAASAMSVTNVDLTALRGARVLHLTGITAALSDDCHALVHTLTAPCSGRPDTRPLLSFDVNHRPSLWPAPAAPLTLLDLARRADIVFVGEDEAEQAWGVTGGPHAIRAALPEPAVLVVKQGKRGATAFGRGPAAFEPAPSVPVVASTGAGDAFAAGFLSGTLRALPLRARLRQGHLFAAAALTTPGDLAAPPARDHADRLAALDDTAWGTLRLAPGWTQAEQATQEASTP